MIREICRDPILLAGKSQPATRADLPLCEDLLDTLRANRERCVGMAANMIGARRRIIVFADEETDDLCVMLNPEIVKSSGAYEAEEGCLSLEGIRRAKRFRVIKVAFETVDFQRRVKTFSGFTAQIIQHELDHLNGILI